LPARLRALWGLGIAAVLFVAVVPYPVRGVVDDDELIHRIHNTVGSVHYLVLWSIPVLLWTARRSDPSMWRISLGTSVAMFVVSLQSGDLGGSLSWMPLVTLLVLWPIESNHARWWMPARRPSIVALLAAALLWWVAVVQSWPLIAVQRAAGGDVHGARYHYSGMAAAATSLAVAATLLVAPLAFRGWRGSQSSWIAAVRSRSSSSRPRPITHS